MAGKGFWSKLFGKGDPDGEPTPDSESSAKPADPEPRPPRPDAPEPARRPQAGTEPDDLKPPKPEPAPKPSASADDGETRVSGTPSKSAFKTDQVSDVYAQALFELALQADAMDATAAEVEQLAGLLASNPALVTLISSRALGRDDRAGVIDRVFKAGFSDTLYKFIHVLNRKDRLAWLPAITASFAARVAESRGFVEVDAFVAQRLDEAEAARVAESIGQALGGKQVVLHQYVDASLIGGLKVRIGDQMIDGSVATQLAKMKQRMIAAGREKARQQVAAEA